MRIARKEEFDTLFSIMEESFPSDERRDRAAQTALFARQDYTVYVLPDDPHQAPRAFIAVWQFSDFAFVEHFAVDAAYRKRGLGAQMLNELFSVLPGQICLELEPPKTDFARRRITFYQRNGFFLNEYPYVQPPYDARKKPLPLLLMTTGGTLCAQRFCQIRDTLLDVVYQIPATGRAPFCPPLKGQNGE